MLFRLSVVMFSGTCICVLSSFAISSPSKGEMVAFNARFCLNVCVFDCYRVLLFHGAVVWFVIRDYVISLLYSLI